MDAGIWEIYGTRYYTHGFGLLFVFPFAVWFFMSSVHTLKGLVVERTFKWRGLVLSACLIVVTLVAVFWDVYQIGQQATKLCNEKAGLHVYRTAEADSVLGLSDIEHWSKYGFKFVEYEDVLKNKTRYFFENGKPTYKRVNQFSSQYELVETRKYITSRIEIIKQEIKDRNSDEVLGESNEFSIDAGWADIFFYNTTGFNYSPWVCSGINVKRQIYISDLIEITLNPIHKQR